MMTTNYFTDHLMNEISDLMQGFNFFFTCQASRQFQAVIVSDINYHNMVKKYCILMYTIQFITWEIVETLHEITDVVHQMLSLCAPYRSNSVYRMREAENIGFFFKQVSINSSAMDETLHSTLKV